MIKMKQKKKKLKDHIPAVIIFVGPKSGVSALGLVLLGVWVTSSCHKYEFSRLGCGSEVL